MCAWLGFRASKGPCKGFRGGGGRTSKGFRFGGVGQLFRFDYGHEVEGHTTSLIEVMPCRPLLGPHVLNLFWGHLF